MLQGGHLMADKPVQPGEDVIQLTYEVLGIPGVGLEFPPDHYHVLGLNRGESNNKTISTAVKNRADIVKRNKSSTHEYPSRERQEAYKFADKFVVDAKKDLTNPVRKKNYDQSIGIESAEQTSAVPPEAERLLDIGRGLSDVIGADEGPRDTTSQSPFVNQGKQESDDEDSPFHPLAPPGFNLPPNPAIPKPLKVDVSSKVKVEQDKRDQEVKALESGKSSPGVSSALPTPIIQPSAVEESPTPYVIAEVVGVRVEHPSNPMMDFWRENLADKGEHLNVAEGESPVIPTIPPNILNSTNTSDSSWFRLPTSKSDVMEDSGTINIGSPRKSPYDEGSNEPIHSPFEIPSNSMREDKLITFHFKGLTHKDGKDQEASGKIKATSKDDAFILLLAKGIYPDDVSQSTGLTNAHMEEEGYPPPPPLPTPQNTPDTSHAVPTPESSKKAEIEEAKQKTYKFEGIHNETQKNWTGKVMASSPEEAINKINKSGYSPTKLDEDKPVQTWWDRIKGLFGGGSKGTTPPNGSGGDGPPDKPGGETPTPEGGDDDALRNIMFGNKPPEKKKNWKEMLGDVWQGFKTGGVEGAKNAAYGIPTEKEKPGLMNTPFMKGASQFAEGIGQANTMNEEGEFRAGNMLGGAGKALGGIGTMAGGRIGMGLGVIGKFGEVLGKSVEKLRDWNEKLHSANIKFSEFSAAMAQVEANQQLRDINLSQKRGNRRAESAEYLAEGKHKLNEAVSPWEDAMANVWSKAQGFFSGILADLIGSVNGIARDVGLISKDDETDFVDHSHTLNDAADKYQEEFERKRPKRFQR